MFNTEKLLPDQERLLVSFTMAAWRFQGTKPHQFVLRRIWEKQEGTGWETESWQKGFVFD